MKITKTPPKSKPRHDWAPIVEALRADPNEWYKVEDLNPRTLTRWSVRRSMPSDFSPAGAFDAVTNNSGVWLVYLGDPIEPWEFYDQWGTGVVDARTFDELERSTEPTE